MLISKNETVTTSKQKLKKLNVKIITYGKNKSDVNCFPSKKITKLKIYSKLEKVPDNIISSYFELLTELDLSFLENANPRALQRRMALEVTTLFHGTEEALKAQSNCEKLFLGQKEKVGDHVKSFIEEATQDLKQQKEDLRNKND